eukprot:8621087-Pyramimonas_sp.AAC.1
MQGIPASAPRARAGVLGATPCARALASSEKRRLPFLSGKVPPLGRRIRPVCSCAFRPGRRVATVGEWLQCARGDKLTD